MRRNGQGPIRWFTAVDETTKKYYRVGLTPSQVRKYDNGMMVSIGLRIGEDAFTHAAFDRVQKKEISHAEWNHSGCQSSCKLRGDAKCGW